VNENPDRQLRLLIVDNEVLITVLLHNALREAGFVVVGPAFNLRQAEHLAACCDIDGALLDVYLDSGESTLSVAKVLRERGIPFMFVTGGSLDDVPGFEEASLLRKPVSTAQIITAARNLCGPLQMTSAALAISISAASGETAPTQAPST
jgi:DNA-binding response OmpR family regulator